MVRLTPNIFTLSLFLWSTCVYWYEGSMGTLQLARRSFIVAYSLFCQIADLILRLTVIIMVNKPWYVFANRSEHLRHPSESFNQLYKLLHFGFEPHPSLYLLGRYYTVDRKRKNARVEGREDGIYYWEFIKYEC